MACAETKQKVIVILGTTAVGKTKLSVEIAKALTQRLSAQAEIISADSVQMYKGMEICADTITPEEAQGVPHHLVGFLSPDEPYTVHDFVSSASRIIDDIHRRRGIPIIAGGTLYYSEALLFRSFCNDNAMKLKDSPQSATSSLSLSAQQPLNTIADDELWSALNRVDPAMANFYHKNDHCRLRRSLKVFHKTGQRHSELIRVHGGKGGELRYDALIIWLDAVLDAIDARIEARLHTMQRDGIFQEIDALYHFLRHEYGYDAIAEHDDNEAAESPYISIARGFGFQAFVPWLRVKYGDEAEADSEALERVACACLAKYGGHTRKYARKQRRWLRNPISRPARLLPIYRLDSTDAARWDEHVRRPALHIARRFVEGGVVDEGVVRRLAAVNRMGAVAEMRRSCEVSDVREWSRYSCEACGKVLRGEAENTAHLRSKKHRKRVRSLKRQRINYCARFVSYDRTEWCEMQSF